MIGSNVFAENIEITSNGGKIRESVIGQGIYNLIMIFQGKIFKVVDSCVINTIMLWFILKMITGEENEQPRYKKSYYL